MRLSLGIAALMLGTGCGSPTGTGFEETQRRCPAARVDATVVSLENVSFAADNARTITFRNGCTAAKGDLELDLSFEGHPAFSVGETALTLGPGEERAVDIAFETRDYGALTATLTATTNDPDVPVLTITLSAVINPDQDADGFTAAAAGGTDCDDLDASVRPGATEVWYDGIDQNCDGVDDFDQDGDGFARLPEGLDCDDLDPAVFPEAVEVHNLIDDDCDGWADEDFVASHAVVITEIMADPDAVTDSEGEWFEVRNTTERSINLQNWLVTDYEDDRFVIVEPFILEPGERGVLGTQDDPRQNGGVTVDYAYSRGSFRLGNTYGAVGLEMAGMTISLVEFDPAWALAPGASLSLDPFFATGGPSNDPRYWCLAVSPMPGGDLGSPGQPNDICTSVDRDGDGYSVDTGDCDDTDDTVNPGVVDRWNGIDDDCDGTADNSSIADLRVGYLDGASGDLLSHRHSLSVGDVDDDGDVELMVGTINAASSGEGKVYTLDAGDAATWSGTIITYDEAIISGTGSYNGEGLVALVQRDVTGDAKPDLVIGGSSLRLDGGVAAAVYDGATATSGSLTAADAVAVFKTTTAFTRAHLTSHLDMNGDGVSEVIYGEPGGFADGISGAGRVYLIDAIGAAGDISIQEDHEARWVGTTTSAYLGGVLGGADLDEDGYDDVVMCAEFAAFASTSAGGCAIVDGGKERPAGGKIDEQATALIGGNAFSDRMGVVPALGFGDFDGNNKVDIAFPMQGGERVLIYFDAGDLAGSYDTTDADVELSMSSGPGAFGSSLAVGDLNGDGIDDLAVGAPDMANITGFGATSPGRVWVFSGDTLASKSTIGSADAYGWVDGEAIGDLLGWSLLVADLDADGQDDLVAGAPNFSGGAGRVSIVLVE